MFKQVLHDAVVVDHSSYVKTLTSHLHEAARIAQTHAVREQDKQARGYNRKVKGTYLNVGDRVLIANKGEKGKKKLADKWNATVYTVTDRNERTHTYKVESSTGDTKVVHRNLVLDVSFLPVVTVEDQLCENDSEGNMSAADSLDSFEEEALMERTNRWMMGGSEDSQSQETQSRGLLETDQSSQAASELEDEGQFVHEHSHWSSNDRSDLSKDSNSTSLVVETGSDSLLMPDVQSEPSNAQPAPADKDCSTEALSGPSKPVHVTDVQAHSRHETVTQIHSSADTGQVVKTRAGRVSKRTSRLIELKAQKPIIARDLECSFRVKAQSMHTVFSLCC